jgi:hypothetical protein
MRHIFEITGIAFLAMALLGAAPAGNVALADETDTAAVAPDPSGQLLSEEQRNEYATRLELTPEQIERVEPILDSAAKARRDALAFYGVDFEANTRPGLFTLIKLKLAIDDINRKAEDLLRPHLSFGQMFTYRRIVSEREADMRNRLLAMN